MYLFIEMYSFSEWQSWSGLTNLLKGKKSLKKQHFAQQQKVTNQFWMDHNNVYFFETQTTFSVSMNLKKKEFK